jgi:hypothetical protein
VHEFRSAEALAPQAFPLALNSQVSFSDPRPRFRHQPRPDHRISLSPKLRGSVVLNLVSTGADRSLDCLKSKVADFVV